MITDERRREVARNLRKLVRLSGSGSCHATSICNALGLIDENRYAPSAYYCGDGVMHLADLIEPESERTCRMIDNGCELCCSLCDTRHDYDDEPNYCMGCGAKVVER